MPRYNLEQDALTKFMRLGDEHEAGVLAQLIVKHAKYDLQNV
jgi:hypothetical protein